jgi:hypothetical protein
MFSSQEREGKLRYIDTRTYSQLAWVVLPNHVLPHAGYQLSWVQHCITASSPHEGLSAVNQRAIPLHQGEAFWFDNPFPLLVAALERCMSALEALSIRGVHSTL